MPTNQGTPGFRVNQVPFRNPRRATSLLLGIGLLSTPGFVLGTLAGCSSSHVAVTGVRLGQTTLSLAVGGTPASLTWTVAPGTASNQKVTWSTSNAAVATVANGLVTPVGPGTATITITTNDGAQTATCAVTVILHDTNVSLDQPTLNLAVGGAPATLNPTVLPAAASNKAVTWSTSNASVATVDNGIVTPVGPGTATITATTVDAGLQASCLVTVVLPVTGVSLAPTSLSLPLNGTPGTLVATLAPTGATNQSVIWSTSNAAVATVANGTVTPVGVGSALITVTTADGAWTATCPVSVAYHLAGTTDLLISRALYAGTAGTVVVGQALPSGGVAIANGTFPGVFTNETPDSSFGVTAPIYLDQRTPSGALVNTLALDPALIATSFASKSELGLNVSTDGTVVTFMGYNAAENLLDVSNSNTPAVVDATNPDTLTFQREIGQVNLATGALQVIPVNAFSGNNGRAAVLANGTYYMVGNAGNGSATGSVLSALSDNTGLQMISSSNVGSGNTTPAGIILGTSGASTGYQRGFSLAQVPNPATPGKNYAADKTGKDDNFRGLTLYNNTLFVSKGSGSNGVNTVYQAGAAGALANGANLSNATINILPGFNALSEKVAEAAATLTATPHPFGMWFANPTTLYVADEGDGQGLGAAGKVTTFAGLQQWQLVNGTWTNTATFQMGLLNQPTYTAGLPWNIQTDGLRNLTGQVNADGSVTLYATTSTVSNDLTHDLGADPNQVVTITLTATSTPANTTFAIVYAAVAGERLGGVTLLH